MYFYMSNLWGSLQKEEFDDAFNFLSAGGNECDFALLMEQLDLKERALRQRISDYQDEYFYSKGKVYKHVENTD